MLPFLQGVVIGFSIAAPVGPIGLLCIRRSLTDGRTAGLVSGLGAATADAAYGLVAAFGLTAISHALLAQRIWLQGLGGLFLLYLGITTAFTRPAATAAAATPPLRYGSAYGSTLFLTLTNPMTILSFLGIFAGIGLANVGGAWTPALLVAGVFCGSSAWWLVLSTSVGWLGPRLHARRLRFINALAGVIIAGFGVWQLTLTVRSLR